jgi:tetratricopeptide (TPR) repeat protein
MEEAIKLDPNAGPLYMNLGSLEIQRKNLAEAEAALKKATVVAPQSAPAYSALGSFYFSNNRLPEAERTFKKAVELDPRDILANRMLASFYFMTGRRAEAESPLRALADERQDVGTRLTLADYYLLGGETDKGVAVLKEVEKQKDGFAPARIRLAAMLHTAGRHADAHQMVDSVLAAQPENSQAAVLKARFLFVERRFDEALERARAAVKANPQSAQAYFLLGQVERAKQNNVEAAQAFTEVLRLNPRAAAAQLELSRLQLASGNLSGAAQSAEQAVKNAPGAIEPRLALARSLLARGDVGRAAAELKLLQQRHPNDAAVITMSGDLHLARKEYVEAKRAYTLGYEEDPKSNDAVAGLIALDLIAGKPGDAHAKMDAHLAKVPATSAVLMLAATTYAATRDFPKAEAVLRKAIELDPANLQAYEVLGQLYYAQGRIAEGRAEFEGLAKREPNSITANTMLGIILYREGKRDEAKARYEKVLAVNPRAPVAANNLAWILVSRGESLDQALQLAQLASTALPDRPEVTDTLAWVYQKKGLSTLALPLLRQVVDKNPQNPQYRYHLGATLASVGDAVGAKKELAKALSLKPDLEEAAEAKRLLSTLQ